MTTDYHQKRIAAMSKGELRAYRRELARAALTGFCANPELVALDSDHAASWSLEQARSVIEHERREEHDQAKY